MKIQLKIIFLLLIVGGIINFANADRGTFNKRKNKIQLNISTINTLKKSIPFNLKSGMVFRGSNIFNSQQIGNNIFSTALVSYKKGNTIYILPYKQKVFISNYSPESGYKLIIRRK